MKEKNKVDHPLLLQFNPHNLLSFGPVDQPLLLQKLNILIGPNGSGKSNLIDALALMRATPILPQPNSNADVLNVLRAGGSVAEWIWKGEKTSAAQIGLTVSFPKAKHGFLSHVFGFRNDEQGFRLNSEMITDTEFLMVKEEDLFYRFDDGRPKVRTTQGKRKLSPETISKELSILAQLRDPELYPEITFLAQAYSKIRIYREWAFGRKTIFRQAQDASARNDGLNEDFSNLGMFLSRLRKSPKTKKAILDKLKDLYEGVTDFDVIPEGGSVQIFFSEGDFSIPATRLSDGTLRYLCLLAILCDPTPPPLICIEEPELGLHPDILPKLADLLVEASERTQLIVTTHSDVLVDAMTERPEVIVVCEKHEGQTQMRRLDKKDLEIWLDKYCLGQMWSKGLIGGNRW